MSKCIIAKPYTALRELLRRVGMIERGETKVGKCENAEKLGGLSPAGYQKTLSSAQQSVTIYNDPNISEANCWFSRYGNVVWVTGFVKIATLAAWQAQQIGTGLPSTNHNTNSFATVTVDGQTSPPIYMRIDANGNLFAVSRNLPGGGSDLSITFSGCYVCK